MLNASCVLCSPAETEKLARKIASMISTGDSLLLNGKIGTGKTHFARTLIHELLLEPEDVPSPTFSLIQTYLTRIGEVWHADLYRLTNLDEIDELGLVDALNYETCIIEWPDLILNLDTSKALHVELSVGSNNDAREAKFKSKNPKWSPLKNIL